MERVHFIVSRQTRVPAPDILQEAPWNMEGPPPYSAVDIEQSLVVRYPIPYRHTHTHTVHCFAWYSSLHTHTHSFVIDVSVSYSRVGFLL